MVFARDRRWRASVNPSLNSSLNKVPQSGEILPKA